MQLALRGLDRVVAFVTYALQASLVVAMAIMLACIALQVVMRYVFGNAPSWTEELALLMFSLCIMGGIALGVREGFHVRLDILLNVLPPQLRRWMETAINAATAAFGAYLAWSGLRFVDVTSGSVSAAIGYPIEMLHALAPIAGALTCLFAVWRLIEGPKVVAAPELAP
jgi:TRAP-type C4-dicarboxylate transport system permease small subunit